MMDTHSTDQENEEQISGKGNGKKAKTASRSARATLYRVTMQNQIRSISIVDQKANIIVGINTILISIIIAVLSIESNYGSLEFIAHLDLNLPFSILFVGCFISGIMALLVVRPSLMIWQKKIPSQLFFLDYRNLNHDSFQEKMDAIVDSDQSVYKTLDSDMYLLGKTVIRKYWLLGIAYLVFLVGFVATVLSFVLLHYIL